MRVELFPFQIKAVNDLRRKTANALGFYQHTHTPQVISLQAPTGAGKTIMMASFVEDVIYGTEEFEEQPDAIFVWLSDSPQLNQQSQNKFLKSDKIRINQCISIQDDNFDSETFEDGKIYFLNTQKIGKSGNLSQHSDSRQYTIWETVENTIKQKSDRLYFIIDEAHRGMQGKDAGRATSIMQRFIKGAPDYGLKTPVPVIIGISATSARFNALVGDTSSTLHKVIVPAADVRASGLLKDRIVITYPGDTQKNNEMAVLDAATDEWVDKVKHWHQYCYEQHYAYVNPVFVIQVKAGNADKISETDLDAVIAKIEERAKIKFEPFEVVHTFGDHSDLILNGLKVSHIEPNDIADNRKVKVVLFKENLSTGWDCPRAETMMSFRHAEDATYIAQLLGRMVRTPMQCRIKVDDSLNDVRLYLPYFNVDTVKSVIDELLNTEGGEIPTFIDDEPLDHGKYKTYSVHISHKKQDDDYPSLFDAKNSTNDSSNGETDSSTDNGETGGKTDGSETNNGTNDTETDNGTDEVTNQDTNGNTDDGTNNGVTIPEGKNVVFVAPANPQQTSSEQPKPVVKKTPVPDPQLFETNIDREGIVKYINDLSIITYQVRSVKINSYLKSLLSLSTLLTHTNIKRDAKDVVTADVVTMMHNYVQKLHQSGYYDRLAKDVLTYKLSIKIFDIFGSALNNNAVPDLFTMSNSELDRQLRIVDAKLGGFGFPYKYGDKYFDENNPDKFKMDCILYALEDKNIEELNNYAGKKFHSLDDDYRKYIVAKSEEIKKQYSAIIANGDAVSKHSFSLPETIQVPVDDNGKIYYDHLFADEKTGKAQIKLNSWEDGVIAEEKRRADFVCWFRNEPRKQWSLTIPYEINNETKAAYPDFIVVRRDASLGYVLDILEPHDPTRTDNLPKAKGFARYAAEEYKIGRLQLIRKVKEQTGEKFLRLDFSKGEIRQKVLKLQTPEELDHLFETDGIVQ